MDWYIGNSKEVFEKWKDRLQIYPQEMHHSDTFNPKYKYYFINGLGDAVFLKVRDRKKAQEICDELYGKGFFTVRSFIRATVS